MSNTGYIAAAYTLSVANCSAGVAEVPAQALSLAAGASAAIVPFQLFVSDSGEVPERHCFLVMHNSQGAVTHSVKVVFYTNSTTFENKPASGPTGYSPAGDRCGAAHLWPLSLRVIGVRLAVQHCCILCAPRCAGFPRASMFDFALNVAV